MFAWLRRHRRAAVLAVVLALVTPSAYAFIDPTAGLRLAALLRIASIAVQIHRTAEAIASATAAIRERQEAMFPSEALGKLGSVFQDVRSVAEELDALREGWTLSVDADRWRLALVEQGELLREEWEALWGRASGPRDDLRRDTPAGDVGSLRDGAQIGGQVAQHGLELGRLEEASARVGLAQHGDVRPAHDAPRLIAQLEHALERRQLAVDGGVGRAFIETHARVRGDAVGRDLDSAGAAEVLAQVRDALTHARRRVASIDDIVVVEHAHELVEGGALERATGRQIEWVFRRERAPGVPEAGARVRRFDDVWKRACTQAGVPGCILHDFRRTAVRNLERAGVPRSAAMAMVGHKTEAIYRRYAITDEAMLREGAIKLAALHEQQLSGLDSSIAER
jgi:hypothetical protein